MLARLAVLFALAPLPVAADVVGAPPLLCPPGTLGYTSHGGTGCAPPLPVDCPTDYAPQVVHDVAYCDPPHATACPPGSIETSLQPDHPACELGLECGSDAECPDGQRCRPVGVCVDGSAPHPRFASRLALGACTTVADCDRDLVCQQIPRCDPTHHRVDPQGRLLPALVRATTRGRWLRLAAGGCLGLILVAGVVVLAALRKRARSRPRELRRDD